MKQTLSKVLAALFLLGLITLPASAAFGDYNTIPHENKIAVDCSVARGIISGRTDGNFDPNAPVTRAEMSKMITIILNSGKAPTLSSGTASYTDTGSHWAKAYVEYCAKEGIVAGMGNGTFAPDGQVTYRQAAKMLLVVLGYDPAVEGFTGADWAKNIDTRAIQKNLYIASTAAAKGDTPLNRAAAAQMIWTTLSQKTVTYNAQKAAVDEPGTLDAKYFGEVELFNLIGETGVPHSTMWFDFTVNSFYTGKEYQGHVANEGAVFVVLNITMNHTWEWEEPIPMFLDDFVLLYGDYFTSPEIAWVEGMAPDTFELTVGKPQTYSFVFCIEDTVKDFELSFVEVFEGENGETEYGETYSIPYTLYHHS